MTQLKILTESSLEGQNIRFTYYKQFLDKTDARNDGQTLYISTSNSANTLTQKILFQLFMVIVLHASQKMWKEASKIF